MSNFLGLSKSIFLIACIAFCAFGITFPERTEAPSNYFPDQNHSTYSGFLTVNATTGSNIFYHLFAAENTNISTPDSMTSNPLIIWLEGGPGVSSIYGAYTQMGPYIMSSNTTLESRPRNQSWATDFHLLFLDQPIGVGFSQSFNGDLVTLDQQAADYLYAFMLRFYEIFPNLKPNDLYIFGQSYGAKIGSVFAYKIFQERATNQINLKGVAFADGLIDPKSQMFWAQMGYAAGVIDTSTSRAGVEEQLLVKTHMLGGDYKGASDIFFVASGITINGAGKIYLDNFRYYQEVGTNPAWIAAIATKTYAYLNNNTFKTAMGIPTELTLQSVNGSTLNNLWAAFSNSTLYTIAPMLDAGIKFMIYAGQDDMNLPLTGVYEYLNLVNSDVVQGWRTAKKKFAYLEGQPNEPVATYRIYQNLATVSINKAGHIGGLDQPESIAYVVKAFINNNL